MPIGRLIKKMSGHEKLSTIAAAERRTERGARHRAHPKDRHGRAALRRRIRFEQNRLGRRLQCAAADALHDAPEHERPHIAGGAAHKRTYREDGERQGVKLFASEQRRQPTVKRHDDDVREDIAGRDPSDLIGRRSQIARHVRQRDVDDRRVDDRHDHAEHHGGRYEKHRRLAPGGRPASRRGRGGRRPFEC